MKKLKSKTTKPICFAAGDWEVGLQSLEGKKTPLFQTFAERLRFNKDWQARIYFRRMR